MILAPVIRPRFFNSNGAPLAGGKLYTYQAGTTTPQATYTDQGGLTPNTNPIILDANGECAYWLDPTLSYKFVLKDASDVVQWTTDQVSAAGLTGLPQWTATTNYSKGNAVADFSGAGLIYVSLTDNNLNNPLTSVTNWRLFGGAARTITANTTLLLTDEFIRSNSTSGNLTHTLPACATTPIGKKITIKDVGTGGNTTSVKGSGTDQVDGANTYGTALSVNASCTFENNGSSWDVIHGAAIPTGSVIQSKLAPRATGSTVAAGGFASSSGVTFTTNNGGIDVVTGLTVTITTTGRPIFVGLVTSGIADSYIKLLYAAGNIVEGQVFIYGGASGTTELGQIHLISTGYAAGSGAYLQMPPSAISYIDTPAAGTYTYLIKASSTSSAFTLTFQNVKLVAYEI